MPYQYVHIGKTGSTLIHTVLRSLPEEHKRQFQIHGHHVTLAEALERRPDLPVFFSVRRPVEIFVSGFNSRLRRGRPRHDVPWNLREQIAFSAFTTPNELAEALSASDRHVHASAEFSMLSINHVRNGLRRHLGSVEFLERHGDDIAFIILQERLEEDLRAFAERAGVPLELAEVSPETRLHTAQADDVTALSELARENLSRWYKVDEEIYDWCVAHHDRLLNASP